MAIKFDNKAPEWDNLGAEPDAELKKGGFLAGYKPPAAYFNWFFNRTYECVKELQEKLVSNLKSLAFKDKVGDDDITAVAANKVTQDSKHRMITDAERSTWNGKADASGSDVSETTVKTLDTITTEFPVPVAGECTKTFLGKVKKFFEDTKNWMTGVCLIGQIVNNCVTNNAKLPLSAAQGKVLMDLYTVLNTNLINMSRTNAINGDIATFADNAPLNTFLRRRYEITNGTASGAPDAQDGYVEIHKTVSNDWIVIYAITNRGTVYTRAKTEGVWGAWTNCNDKLGVSIQRLEYRWDNQNPKLIVTDPNGYSAYVSLTKYQG